MTDFVGWIVLIVLVVVGAIIAVSLNEHQKGLQRHQQRVAWGSRHGLTPLDKPRENAWLAKTMPGVPREVIKHLDKLLPRNGSAYNFLAGRPTGRQIEVFDLLVNGGENPDYHYGIVAVTLNSRVPSFAIRKHNLWDNLAALAGIEDLKIGYTAFDAMFHIKASDPVLAEAFDLDMRKELMSNEQIRWECNGLVIVGRLDKLCSNDEFDQILKSATYLAEQVESVRI